MRGETGDAIAKTIPWKTQDHLETQQDIAAYLKAVFEDGDPLRLSYYARMRSDQSGPSVPALTFRTPIVGAHRRRAWSTDGAEC